MCRATVNSYSRGRAIPVTFRGTGAWTDNHMVCLPAVMDLAEIPWETAKAFTGYAIHEVSHIRETDFEEVRRSYAEGKLVQAFANGIEDYRIERRTSRMFKGAALDLAALRVYIHPEPDDLPPQWYADPRRSGPVALTWTGADLNGFANPKFAETISRFPDPVRVLLERWTSQMKDVRSTREAVDLAILFAQEACEYAEALKQAANENEQGDDSGQPNPRTQGPSQPGNSSGQSSSPADAPIDPAQSPSTPDQSAQSPNSSPTPGLSENDNNPGGDPFGSIIDPSAAFDDLLDALAEQIRDSAHQTGAPEVDPDPTDGEINPAPVKKSIEDANSAAPQYDSENCPGHPNNDSADNDQPAGNGAARNKYDDRRIKSVPITGDGSTLTELTGQAAGVISTTARTIRRLLVSEEKTGTLRNRRSGDFDIRNISGIVRDTGAVYKRSWQRPGPTTLLATLIDMSGSMSGGKLSLAMTGGLAIAQAIQNTRIEHWMYGFAGYSPNVLVHEFAGPGDRPHTLRRRIDSFHDVSLGATPTGEAIAAIGSLMDEAAADRRVLLVLTDGDADDEDVAAQAAALIQRRGIEVAGIGIRSPSIKRWIPDAHIIHNITELPAALLATIDPRQNKLNGAR